jgi:amidophosphoribosyltransferase
MLTTGRDDADHFHDECGVFAVFGHPDAAALTALGLHALQHRGQEAAGIVAYDGEQFNAHRGMGLVGDNFGSPDVIGRLPGHSAVGHVRYATTGEVALRNVQPLFFEIEFGGLAICHNGNLTNSYQLRKQLVRRGSLFHTTSDTEVINHLIATSVKDTIIDRLVDGLRQVEGAYSLAALTQESVIGVRDPLGVRPLVVGRLADAWIISSETCALDIIGADFVRDVEPGEIVIADADGLHSLKPFTRKPERFCVFEYIYFARPDSVMEGRSVYEARKRIGRELARESPVDADIVVPVPDSGVPAALGYAQESGLPFELGIIRNHYVGRTFIEPTDQIRHLGVRLKHNANRADLVGKRVVLVDDSIVRGTTSREIVQMAREAGARKVYFASASPPVRFPNVYGIDMPNQHELVATGRTEPEIAREISADLLIYQELDALKAAVREGNPKLSEFEASCFDGKYITGDVTADYLSQLAAVRDVERGEMDADAEAREPVPAGD